MRAWRLLACTLLARCSNKARRRTIRVLRLLVDWKAFRVDEEQHLLSIATRYGRLIAVKAPQACSAALQVDMMTCSPWHAPPLTMHQNCCTSES